MNVLQAIETFRSDEQDEGKGMFWSDDELTGYYSEANKEACIRSGLLTNRAFEYEIGASDAEIGIDKSIVEISNVTLIDASGARTVIDPSSIYDLDRINPDWRGTTEKPSRYVHQDTSIRLSSLSDDSYTIVVEASVTPDDFEDDDDEPSISQHHHSELLHWVRYRAYKKQDADSFNSEKSAVGYKMFERYFGRRKTADLRKRQNANRPHRNQPCW